MLFGAILEGITSFSSFWQLTSPTTHHSCLKAHLSTKNKKQQETSTSIGFLDCSTCIIVTHKAEN